MRRSVEKPEGCPCSRREIFGWSIFKMRAALACVSRRARMNTSYTNSKIGFREAFFRVWQAEVSEEITASFLDIDCLAIFFTSIPLPLPIQPIKMQ
ncbi:MAG TPA: hypothetical protein VNX66_16610 [Candidatus Sulfotelmatobacter sp.]|jgi:hypothetical protein|nr:hypothetical protein [Candidatus Sulfotelmatobacter sp.]